MPEILDRCVAHVMGQGHDEASAYAICRVSIGLKEDGSEDGKETDITERDMLIRAASEITKRNFGNFPRLRKWMPVCEAIGQYVNGPQEGKITVRRFLQIVENYKKHPRQIPVYLLVGQPNPEHPEDLDSRLADGWVEGLKVENNWLMADVVVNGSAAVAVLQDGVRGASIQTVKGFSYDGKPIGEVLEHVVLTNEPFVKGMNIAAISRQQGGEKIAYVFTALSHKEATMADKEKDKGGSPPAPEPGEDLSLKVKTLEALAEEKTRENLELTAKIKNLEEDVERFKANPQLGEAMVQLKAQERQLRAEKIRRLVKKGVDAGQFTYDQSKGYDHDSDEGVLTWFKASMFKDSLDKLEFALATFPKKALGLRFVSGAPKGEDGTLPMTPDEKARLPKGMTPESLALAAQAENADEYARLKAEKGVA